MRRAGGDPFQFGSGCLSRQAGALFLYSNKEKIARRFWPWNP